MSDQDDILTTETCCVCGVHGDLDDVCNRWVDFASGNDRYSAVAVCPNCALSDDNLKKALDLFIVEYRQELAVEDSLRESTLTWKQTRNFFEATVGDYAGGDGVRFSLEHRPTCYRRGVWRLLVEVAQGPNHEKWGCFDDQDQPMRYYHAREAAESEAQAIADVLVRDRGART